MSRMACPCGAIVTDDRYPSRTEAKLFAQEDQEPLQSAVGRDIARFFSAIQAGNKNAWISHYFSADYPVDATNEEVIEDILIRCENYFCRSVAECNQCGRIFIQLRPGVNEYQAYAPEGPGYAAALSGVSRP